MAQKRMFTMKIVDSDAFLDMPMSAQCLYFHLNMRADDDGFIGNALEKVYNVIDSRVRADKPMILTTNLTFDEMMRNPDIRYRRIYDRIFEHCFPVEIPGKSFRIIKAAQRQKKLADYFGG